MGSASLRNAAELYRFVEGFRLIEILVFFCGHSLVTKDFYHNKITEELNRCWHTCERYTSDMLSFCNFCKIQIS